LCRHCRQWLSEQDAYFELQFLSFQSPEVDYRFPGVRKFRPEEQLVVIGDDGSLYQGPDAWIMCLYALTEYREWSLRLAAPALRPFAQRVCELVSSNRQLFSRWFQHGNDHVLAETLARELPEDSCRTGECRNSHPY
jgi:predicted DCC family thiol-disulfide oxidoreductase YuxK